MAYILQKTKLLMHLGEIPGKSPPAYITKQLQHTSPIQVVILSFDLDKADNGLLQLRAVADLEGGNTAVALLAFVRNTQLNVNAGSTKAVRGAPKAPMNYTWAEFASVFMSKITLHGLEEQSQNSSSFNSSQKQAHSPH